MAYQTLKTLYHRTPRDADAVVRAELERRLSSPATIRFDYHLEGRELFVVLHPALVALMETVWRNEIQLNELWAALPGAARHHYLVMLVIEEIQATNEIENVASTRQEIAEALAAVQYGRDDGGEPPRFRELVTSYWALFGSQQGEKAPQDMAELRELYDSLLGSEIAVDDRPDGQLFRAGPVYIVDMASAQPIHTGAPDEESIIAGLRSMFAMRERAQVPELLVDLIEHFLFEHIHPFYDGNGRFGRFLLSLRLARRLSAPTALAVSAALHRNVSAYYKAFQTVEHRLNYGEATSFVESLLRILARAQEERMRSLRRSMVALERFPEQVSRSQSWARVRFPLRVLGRGAPLHSPAG